MSKSNLSYKGLDAYSYGTCIRTTCEHPVTGVQMVICNVTKYSVTTSRHQSAAFRDIVLPRADVTGLCRGVTARDLRVAFLSSLIGKSEVGKFESVCKW
jgi:hypothetical protein